MIPTMGILWKTAKYIIRETLCIFAIILWKIFKFAIFFAHDIVFNDPKRKPCSSLLLKIKKYKPMLHLSINKTSLCLQIQTTFPNRSTLQMLRARHPDSTPCFKLPTKITKHLGPDPWQVAPGGLHISLHSSFATFVLLSYWFNRLLHTQQSSDLSPELKIPATFCSSCVPWLLLCWSQAYQARTVQSATSSHVKTRSLFVWFL